MFERRAHTIEPIRYEDEERSRRRLVDIKRQTAAPVFAGKARAAELRARDRIRLNAH